ncbi:hypothetical protein Cantr_05503 [Candida viswanathii]|uniref:Uncharacterized protein n=1 Tax=Candida viswanathii TaxID=5486 RepID=A0A367XQH9_9ASCO|nr:hypothetical protein Cantr_05503 [Candida viswanathii]
MSLFRPTLAVALLSSDVSYKLRHTHPVFGKRYKKDGDVIHTLTPKSWSIATETPEQNTVALVSGLFFILIVAIVFAPSNRHALILLLFPTVILLSLLLVKVEYLSLPTDPEQILKDERLLIKHATVRNGVLDATYSAKRVDVHFKEVVEDGLYLRFRDLLAEEGIRVAAIGDCQFKTGSKRLHEKKYPIVNLQLSEDVNRTYVGLSTYSYLALLENIHELTRLKDKSPTGHSQWITYTCNGKTNQWKRDWVKGEDDNPTGPNALVHWWSQIYEKQE